MGRLDIENDRSLQVDQIIVRIGQLRKLAEPTVTSTGKRMS
jgi:hypothetical protein